MGEVVGSSTFTPNGCPRRRVAPEFAINKALPTCKFTSATGPTLRSSRPCTTTAGSARAIRIGAVSAGQQLPNGRHTWILTGSDADGGR